MKADAYMMNDFDFFQEQAVVQRPRDPDTIDFEAMRLGEEVGEVLGVVKRSSRAIMGQPMVGKRSMKTRDRERLKDEMSDVLHSLARLANYAGFSLAEVALYSLDKQAKN